MKKIIFISAVAVVTVVFIGVMIALQTSQQKAVTETPQNYPVEAQKEVQTQQKRDEKPPNISPLTTQQSQKEEVSDFLLTIDSPANGTVIKTAKVTIKGKTEPNAEVFVNDKELFGDSKGNFTAYLDLDEGENLINIMANNDLGNSKSLDYSLTYNVE